MGYKARGIKIIMSSWYITKKEKQKELERKLKLLGRNAGINAYKTFEKIYKEHIENEE